MGENVPRNPSANQTIVHSATSKGTSYRTTIPAFIISQMGLEKGSVLQWEIKDDDDGKPYLRVREIRRGN